MDSVKIETTDIQPGKWYWHYGLDRPVFVVFINEQRNEPYVLIPSVGYLNGNGKRGKMFAKTSANFYSQPVECKTLGEIKINPSQLDF